MDNIKFANKPVHGNYKDKSGIRFNDLVVLGYAGRFKGQTYWFCLCDCGKIKKIQGGNLGIIKTCGCKQGNIVHGMNETKTYSTWHSMRNRCDNHNTPGYNNYGGRGIKYCKQWRSFKNFYKDMGNKPHGKTLDRIDNNGNYCKENCRWATMKQQGRNTRTNRIIVFMGKAKCLTDWSDETGVKRSTLDSRLDQLGWSVEKTLTTPVQQPTGFLK